MRKRWPISLSFVLALSIILTACGQSKADTDVSKYPKRTIEVYVGHGAGGGTDTFARFISDQLEDILGVTINVVNMEGAGGVIANEAALKQPADGYTLIADSSLAITAANGTFSDGLSKLKPIARFQADTFALMVNPDKYADLEEFLEYAEQHPGEVTIGGVSIGSMDEITASRFIQATGLDMTYVPFEGSGDASASLLGGHTDALLEEFGPSIDYLESGDMHPIIVFAEDRLKDYPDVPTTVENGWDITEGVERGFTIHADSPNAIVKKLEGAMKQVYDSEAYKEHEKERYLHLREGWMGSEEYRKKIEKDIDLFKEVVSDLGSGK